MKALQFTPVITGRSSAATQSTPIRELTTSATYALKIQANGRLSAERVQHDFSLDAADRVSDDVVAFARHCCNSRDTTWAFVACASSIWINGVSPLAVAVLEPGALLAIGDRFWLISSLWQPEAVEAPADLRDKPCPVCGGELGIAPVVQCGCGRWTHLENAAVPDNEDALNCFMAADSCGGCGRPALLEPQMFPEVSDRLVEWSDEDEWHRQRGD
jgi:hypothetical protein